MDILTHKELVKELLIKSETSRNSDSVLVANVWNHYITKVFKVNPNSCSGTDILGMVANDELPNFESIGRIRRKWQQTHPELRGTNWKYKQDEEEDKIIGQVRDFHNTNETIFKQ